MILHFHAHFRHRVTPVSVTLRPSATVAAWHPGPAGPFRGKASVRLVCGSACLGAPRSKLAHAQPPPLRLRPLHPRPGNAGRCFCQPIGSQPLLALLATLSVCLGKCHADSDRNAAPQTFLLYPSASTGPAASLAKPDHASFFACNRNYQGSSHRSRSVGQRSLPGKRRASKRFCQYAGPSDNRALCKVAESCRSCRVYSPLRFAYGYIMQAIIRRASRWRRYPIGSRCAVASVGFGQVRPLLAWPDAVYNKSPHHPKQQPNTLWFRRSAPCAGTRR